MRDTDAIFEEDMFGFDVERGEGTKTVDANVDKLRRRKQVLAELVNRFDSYMADALRDGDVDKDRDNYFLNMLTLQIEQVRGEIKWIEVYLEKNIG